MTPEDERSTAAEGASGVADYWEDHPEPSKLHDPPAPELRMPMRAACSVGEWRTWLDWPPVPDTDVSERA